MNPTSQILRSIYMKLFVLLHTTKNRSICLLGPGAVASPLCFFAGCMLELAKLFMEESQRQSASSREGEVGEGDARLKHIPRSTGSSPSSVGKACPPWDHRLAQVTRQGWGGRAVQLCLVHPTLSLATLPHPGKKTRGVMGGEGKLSVFA